MVTSTKPRRIQRLANAAYSDIRLYFIILLYLQILRWVFITITMTSTSSPQNFLDVLFASYRGFFLDIKIAFSLTALLIPLSMLVPISRIPANFIEFVRASILSAFIFFTLFATLSSCEFFLEFHTQLDIRIFNGLDDGLFAITSMLVSGYHLIEILLTALSLALLYGFYLHPRLMRSISSHSPKKPSFLLANSFAFFAFASILAFISYLFSFGAWEVRHDTSMHLPSKLLEASIIPAPIALYKASFEYRQQEKAYAKKRYSNAAVKDAIEKLFPETDSDKPANIDEYFLKSPSGKFVLPKKPSHIFLLFMERYDNWPLLKQFEALGVTNGLKGLISEGAYFKNFLPGQASTMPSLQVTLLGLPNIGLKARHFTNSRFPGAIAKTMTSLGYKTRLFYGGSMSWNDIGLVASSQGFSETLGFSGNIKNYQHMNMWGVDDESLFEFVSEVVISDQAPSFNLILTSTNHPPYDLPLAKHNVPLAKIGAAIDKLAATNGSKDFNIKRMGHLWYSDNRMASFIKEMRTRFPSALFVITGDHYSNSHIYNNPPLHQKSTVPLVLVGPAALKDMEYDATLSGSQLDIAPTIVELIAPKEFQYYSYGNSLFSNSHPPYSFGSNKIMLVQNEAYRLDFSSENNLSRSDLPSRTEEIASSAASQIEALNTIVWWRMIHGNELP